jgi:hypothetical protein
LELPIQPNDQEIKPQPFIIDVIAASHHTRTRRKTWHQLQPVNYCPERPLAASLQLWGARLHFYNLQSLPITSLHLQPMHAEADRKANQEELHPDTNSSTGESCFEIIDRIAPQELLNTNIIHTHTHKLRLL